MHQPPVWLRASNVAWARHPEAEAYGADILTQGAAVCRRMLSRDPLDPRALRLRATLACRRGEYEVAIACLRASLRQAPDEVATYVDLGEACRHQGDIRDAMAASLQAIRLSPRSPSGYRELAAALSAEHRQREADAMLHQALLLEEARCTFPARPDEADRLAAIADMLVRQDSLAEAIAPFREALIANPGHCEAARGLVKALESLHRRDEAVDAWCQLGAVCVATHRPRDAAWAYGEALARCPECLHALVQLAHAHMALGEPEKASVALERALAIDPYHARAHVSRGLAAYETHDHERAWDEMRWFYHPNDSTLSRGRWRDVEQPMWDGGPLAGRTILVWTDQGLGDTIIFLRYLNVLEALGATVIVECHHKGLAPLIERMPSVDRVVIAGTPVPSFDVHAPLVFLPSLFQSERTALPSAIPYLDVDPELRASWRQRIERRDDELTIGICWGGNPEHPSAVDRFVRLAEFARFAGLSDTRIVSLQLGPQAAELATPPSGLKIECLLNESSSISDTASVVLNLDLVISVDTMVSHLAGALGANVWTLLRYAPSWRWWNAEGDRTSWYPTMRLFRQTRAGDWSEVFTRVSRALSIEYSFSRPEVDGATSHGRPVAP